jgi:site-specific DNA-methyltransferase (adenine-specific)
VERRGGTWAAKYSRFERYKRSKPKSDRAVQTLSEGGYYPPEKEQSATGIWWDVAPKQEYFDELFRVSRNQIIFGANYFPNMPPTRCFIVWRKRSISEKFSMAMAEYAWTSFDRNAKVFECTPQGKKSDPRFHPTQKPIELYSWIFRNFAKEGDKILDTHLGSGSSAIAALALGFEFTGIEIDQEYYQKAKERIEKYNQGKLQI